MAAETGLTLDVSTTSPGLQFYTAGLLKSQNPLLGKNGVAYPQFSGLTVETQASAIMHLLQACGRLAVAD